MQRASLCGIIAAATISVSFAAQQNQLPAVLGIATGPQFKLNGALVAENANLMTEAEVASLDETVTIHLKDDCDYLLSPNSSVRIEDHKLILETGKVRARHAGHCKVGAYFYTITGDTPGADGVIALSGGNVQVSSLTGTLEVAGNQGTLAGAVAPGATSTFSGAQAGISGAAAGGASGATASTGAAATTKALWIYGGTLGVTLAGLGLAVDAILQPGSRTPTSP